MGIAEDLFGCLWGKIPDILGKSELRDLPSANFDKPAEEVPLYLIADARFWTKSQLVIHGCLGIEVGNAAYP